MESLVPMETGSKPETVRVANDDRQFKYGGNRAKTVHLRRHRKALQAAENGLTRKQIRDLFHGNISSSSIDQALEKLSSLGAATCRFTGAARGRPATLWSAIGHEYAEPMKEENPEESLRRRLSALVRTF